MAASIYLLISTLFCVITGVALLLVLPPQSYNTSAGDSNNNGYFVQKEKFEDSKQDQSWFGHVTIGGGSQLDNDDRDVADKSQVRGARKVRGITAKLKKNKPLASLKVYRWGKWGRTSGCSKPCDVGVKYRKRNCYKTSNDVTSKTSSHLCRGKDRVYILCNKRACTNEETGGDSREDQCSVYNKKPYMGTLYHWKPYDFSGNTHPDFRQCELVCTSYSDEEKLQHPATAVALIPAAASSQLSVRLAGRVSDGTACSVLANDVQGVCLEGRCRAIGCNKKLGSRRILDRCGVCGGRNSSCKIQNGTFRESLDRGYNTILTLPPGAANLDIVKEWGGSASLALRTKQGRHILKNIKSAVVQATTTKNIAGAEFHYNYSNHGEFTERLWTTGPTNQTLYVLILSPSPNVSVVITYSYTIPKRTRAWRRRHKHKVRKHKPIGSSTSSNNVNSKNSAKKTISTPIPVSHYYDLDERRKVSPTEQGKSVTPEDRKHQRNTLDSVKNDTLNMNNNTLVGRYGENGGNTAPFIKYSGRTNDKAIVYVPPEVNGNVITNKDYTDYDRTTHSYNLNIWNTGPSVTVSPKTGTIDSKSHQTLLLNALDSNRKYNWRTDVTACSQTCDPKVGVRLSLARCHDDEDNEVDQSLCDVSRKPKVTSSECKGKSACDPRWVATRWSRCSANCGHGYQYRTVRCWRILSPGLDSSVHNDLCQHLKKPVTSKKCRNIDCDVEPEWVTSKWNQCSADCGQGVQTRSVECNAGVNRCNIKAKPASTRPCVLTSCENRMQWVVSKWSQCTDRCGLQHRRVGCRSNNGTYVNDSNCNISKKPLSTQLCDTKDCPTTWVPQMWSKCSTSCGEGTTFRSIVCGRIRKSIFEQLPESDCEDILKPHAAASCRGRSCPGHYTGKWYTGEWSQCSYSCGVGSRSRLVNCYLDNRPSDQCDVLTKPTSVEQCRLPPCSTAAARTASVASVRLCRDDPRVGSCALVVQHSLCQHHYYRRACCLSCSAQP